MPIKYRISIKLFFLYLKLIKKIQDKVFRKRKQANPFFTQV